MRRRAGRWSGRERWKGRAARRRKGCGWRRRWKGEAGLEAEAEAERELGVEKAMAVDAGGGRRPGAGVDLPEERRGGECGW